MVVELKAAENKTLNFSLRVTEQGHQRDRHDGCFRDKVREARLRCLDVSRDSQYCEVKIVETKEEV